MTGVAKTIEGYQERLDFRCQMIADGTPQLAGTLPFQSPSNETTAGNCKDGENGGPTNQALKAMLRYLATEDLEFNFSADYSHTDAEPGAQALLTGTQSTGLDLLYNNLVIQPRFGLRYDDNRFVTASNPFTTYMSLLILQRAIRGRPTGLLPIPGARRARSTTRRLTTSISRPSLDIAPTTAIGTAAI